MRIGETLLAEFDQEMANTRKTLERVPSGKFDYKPHQKSPTMGWMVGHLCNIPNWLPITMQTAELDLGQPFERPPAAETTEQVLREFDKSVAAARAELEKAEDSAMTETWTLRNGEQVILSIPRIAVIRGMILNHLIHHRAQLTVYLRLNDIPVPALYGPSADEGGGF